VIQIDRNADQIDYDDDSEPAIFVRDVRSATGNKHMGDVLVYCADHSAAWLRDELAKFDVSAVVALTDPEDGTSDGDRLRVPAMSAHDLAALLLDICVDEFHAAVYVPGKAVRLLEDGEGSRAALYIMASVVLSIGAAFIGLVAARQLIALRR